MKNILILILIFTLVSFFIFTYIGIASFIGRTVKNFLKKLYKDLRNRY